MIFPTIYHLSTVFITNEELFCNNVKSVFEKGRGQLRLAVEPWVAPG
jgi:hypothetical protein